MKMWNIYKVFLYNIKIYIIFVEKYRVNRSTHVLLEYLISNSNEKYSQKKMFIGDKSNHCKDKGYKECKKNLDIKFKKKFKNIVKF